MIRFSMPIVSAVLCLTMIATSSACDDQTPDTMDDDGRAAGHAAPNNIAIEAAAITEDLRLAGNDDLAAAERVLGVLFVYQKNGSTCAPAATRIALSARLSANALPSESLLAQRMGTDIDRPGHSGSGTPSVNNVVPVLNQYSTGGLHQSFFINTDNYRAQTQPLAERVRIAIDGHHALVANIHGTGTDVRGGKHTYANGHYIALIGYRDQGNSIDVLIADPSGPTKGGQYWMSVSNLAYWIASRGYVAWFPDCTRCR